MQFLLKAGIIMAFTSLPAMSRLCAQDGGSKYEVGLMLSNYLYQGDLTPKVSSSLKTPGFGFMVFATRILSPVFSLRTNLAIGSLKGDDAKYGTPAWRRQRNFAFTSPVAELSELLTWNILGKNSRGIAGFSPFVFGGVGVSFLNVHRDLSRFNAEYFAEEPHVQAGLNIDLAKPAHTAAAIIPFGIGLRYALSPSFTLVAESSYRFTSTDYLDGFSQAANPSKKDQYGSNSVGIIYRFRTKTDVDCPVIPK